MAVTALHPFYIAFQEYWEKCGDAYAGEEAVKAKRETYLPATPGQIIDGMANSGQKGYKNYEAYLGRAVFHDFYSEAVEKFVGIMHQREATFELPEKMKYLLEKASIEGESLLALLRRINEHQLSRGRLGLLADSSEEEVVGAPQFYISLYQATAIRNWNESADKDGKDKLQMVVLDESGPELIDEFEWKDEERYRVLKLEGESYSTFRNVEGVDEPVKIPTVLSKPFDNIPFVFVNAKDILPRPDTPPLMRLCRLCFTIYKSEADYRQSLFLQSQDTLVVIGGTKSDDEIRVGAGARIDVDQNGDAKFIGVQSTGLSEQRSALENDKMRAETLAGKLVTTQKTNQESGEALKTRLAAQTATLNVIAKTGAFALETLLKKIARSLGEDEKKVKVIPNLEFADANLMGDDLVKLMTAKGLGLPLSEESVHLHLVERGLTILTYEEEKKRLKAEPPPASAPTPGVKPDNQVKGVLNGETK